MSPQLSTDQKMHEEQPKVKGGTNQKGHREQSLRSHRTIVYVSARVENLLIHRELRKVLLKSKPQENQTVSK